MSFDDAGFGSTTIAILLDKLAQTPNHLSGKRGIRYVDQRGNSLFDRAIKKGFKHSAECRAPGFITRPYGAVKKTHTILTMCEMPFLLEDAQQSANGGIARCIVQVIKDILDGRLAARVDDVHDLPLTA